MSRYTIQKVSHRGWTNETRLVDLSLDATTYDSQGKYYGVETGQLDFKLGVVFASGQGKGISQESVMDPVIKDFISSIVSFSSRASLSSKSPSSKSAFLRCNSSTFSSALFCMISFILVTTFF